MPVEDILFCNNEPRTIPFFRVGQLVAAYDDPHHGLFITYGKITAREWQEASLTWFYAIHTTPHNTFIVHQSSHLREVRPSEARMGFVLIRNPMDRAP